jgi:Domain of unknown function (DUF4386)
MAARVEHAGTRVALLGAVLYLSEWLVIPFVPDVPTDTLGDATAEGIAAAYDGHGTQLAFLAGYLAVALLGRVVFVAALRSVLTGVRERLWAEIALAVMTIGVAIEIVQLGLVAAAGWLAEAGAAPEAILAFDAAGTVLFTLIVATTGAAVVSASLAMVISRQFPRWIAWLGLVAGALVTFGGIVGTTGAGDTGTLHDLADPLTGPPVAAFWLWMLATSVVLFRRA